MSEVLELLGGPGTLIGILVVPAVLALARRARLWLRRRRYLGFGARGLDVVLPATRATVEGVVRPTTGLGSVQALGIAARVIGRYYRDLPFRVQLALDLTRPLDADLLCIGGPRANGVSGRFLDRVRGALDVDLVFDDVGLRVRVPGFDVDGFGLELHEGRPRRDLGLVVLGSNPFGQEDSSRGLLCCGLTSYGTAAAAAWFFEGVVEKAEWAAEARRQVPRSGPQPDQFYVAVIEFTFDNGVVLARDLRASSLVRRARSRPVRAGG